MLPGVNPPLKPKRSGRSRKTPQPDLLPQRSSRRTPAPEQLKPRPSSRKTPITTTGKERGRPSKKDALEGGDVNVVPNSYPTQSDGEGTVTKKRKTGGDAIEKSQDPPKSTKPSRGRPKAIPNPTNALAQPEGSPLERAPTEAPQKRKKKRKSIGQNSTRKRIKLASAGRQQDPIQGHVEVTASAEDLQPLAQGEIVTSPGKQLVRELDSQTEVPESTGPDIQQPTEVAGLETGAQHAPSFEEPVGSVVEEENSIAAVEEQPTRPKKRKKRKSIGQVQKPRKKSTGASTIQVQDSFDTQMSISKAKAATMPAQAKGRRRKPLSEPKRVEQDNVEENRSTDPIESTDLPTRKKGRPGAPRKPLPTVDEEPRDEPQTQSQKPGRPRKPTMPTAPPPTTAPKPTQISKPKHHPPSKTRTKPPPKNSIPITVYRLSHPLPPSSTSLNIPQPPPLKTPNAVDIISQFCRELLSKPDSTTSSSPTSLERKRKQRTTDIYSEELGTRLFDLTQTLDTNTTLATRVRLATREEKILRAELAALQSERAAIALRKQELDEAREKARKEDALNALLANVEKAVKKGREMGWDESENVGMGGFEVLAWRVAGDVSGRGGGGWLERVRAFNGVLEGLVGGA